MTVLKKVIFNGTVIKNNSIYLKTLDPRFITLGANPNRLVIRKLFDVFKNGDKIGITLEVMENEEV